MVSDGQLFAVSLSALPTQPMPMSTPEPRPCIPLSVVDGPLDGTRQGMAGEGGVV